MFYRMPERVTPGVARLACLFAVVASACSGYGDMPPYDGSSDTAPDPDVLEEPAGEPGDDPTGEPVEEPVDDPGVEPHPDCIEERTPVVSPGHGAGTTCISCHSMYFPPMTVAGTLYADVAGAMPVVGATILVTDSTGATVEMISTLNGNFYTDRAVTPPLAVAASRCPHHLVMPSGATTGECNSCHGYGSRIHLP
jgi:hypothetical protein